MAYNIQLSHEAVEDLARLTAHERAAVVNKMQQILTVNPTQESRSRIKRLRQPAPTEFRLRVDDVRVYYDVETVNETVWVVRILRKSESLQYLASS